MDNKLGDFLRTAREAVTPAEAGLPAGARRRTPGLRRSELAMLAGVSVEYVTRMEQGRDRNPSAHVLASLADALRLGSHERIRLHELSKTGEPGFRCISHDYDPVADISPAVRAMVQQLEPAPAMLLDGSCQVLLSTATYRTLMTPAGLFDRSPNLASYHFGDPRARELYPDWDCVADDLVAQLKHGPFCSDDSIADLAEQLTVTAGAALTERVQRVTKLPAPTGTTRLQHPDLGPLRLNHEELTMKHRPGLRLIVQLPADTATGDALDRLAGRRPGALHAVATAS